MILVLVAQVAQAVLAVRVLVEQAQAREQA